MNLGPITTDIARDAGTLCAVAARHDPMWGDAAIKYLTKAMELGLDPKELRSLSSKTYRAIKDRPEFIDFCNSQQFCPPIFFARISDPVQQ